ncbi:hypothetical protein BpHYR1_050268 [Brachionus plicatilis]|uniref:Transmembrane protein n=1 Tax=Brachionus plicatilis TaxID=10195 RepID=A0A3M7RVM7_BRAPC|nr:hypothetical protein BpHYR1_050268 [Brachionus plicatilis]
MTHLNLNKENRIIRNSFWIILFLKSQIPLKKKEQIGSRHIHLQVSFKLLNIILFKIYNQLPMLFFLIAYGSVQNHTLKMSETVYDLRHLTQCVDHKKYTKLNFLKKHFLVSIAIESLNPSFIGNKIYQKFNENYQTFQLLFLDENQ